MAKIRAGFVSNSSSSSFVVAFPKDLEMTTEAVKKYLFGDKKAIGYYNYAITTEDAAERVLCDIKEQKPNRKKVLLEALDGWLHGSPDYEDFKVYKDVNKKHEYDVDWEAYEKAMDEYKVKVFEEFKKNLPKGMNIYSFEYSDNDGEFFCTMEHGDIFENVPHIKVSRH